MTTWETTGLRNEKREVESGLPSPEASHSLLTDHPPPHQGKGTHRLGLALCSKGPQLHQDLPDSPNTASHPCRWPGPKRSCTC